MGHVEREEGRERQRGEPDAAAKIPKIQKGWVTKWFDYIEKSLWGRKGSPASGLESSGWRAGCAVILTQTEGSWENLVARSASKC